MSEQSLARARLLRELQLDFSDVALLDAALTHRSASSTNNERLEFLGDAILDRHVAQRLYALHPEASEGELSRMRAHLVRRDTLAKVARENNLGPQLRLGAGELRSGGRSRDSILADALEALIAAVFLDQGDQAATSFIERLLGDRIDESSPELHGKDPKTLLQEALQARQLALPVYTIKAQHGAEHNQVFDVACRLGDLGLETEGRGRSRRSAEQDAARKALQVLDNA